MKTPARKPTFIIAGAMRSGTTSMARWLGAHPDVFVAPVKEVHYFDRNYERGPDWYADHFRDGNDESAIGEATPNYLYHEQSLKRIAQDLPDVALIVLLRDPVARAYSHYQHRLSREGEALTFEQAIEAEPTRLHDADELVRAHYSYVDRGRYLGQIRHAFQLFPPTRVFIRLFEDLRDAPHATFTSAADFLRIDPFVPDIVGRPTNTYQRFRSNPLREVSHRLPRTGARILGRLNQIDTDGYPPMSARAHDMLADIYADERQELAALLGRDLDRVWN